MNKRQTAIAITFVIILAVALFVWITQLYHQELPAVNPAADVAGESTARSQTGRSRVAIDSSSGTRTETGSGSGSEAFSAAGNVLHEPIPQPTVKLKTPAESKPPPLPPPPPMPEVSAEASEQQRKEIFDLHQSVDHIVTVREPFKVGDETVTIEAIKKRLEQQPGGKSIPGGSEPPETSSSYLRKPIPKPEKPAYYGVRQVRPGENLWNVHYQILRDYYARRQVDLVRTADEPAPSGRSSGVGRLLKFLEGVVYVYDFKNNRLVTDLNLIQPDSIIIFFKISDVFSALDPLSAEDLQTLRLVRQRVILEQGPEPKDLFGKEDFQ